MWAVLGTPVRLHQLLRSRRRSLGKTLRERTLCGRATLRIARRTSNYECSARFGSSITVVDTAKRGQTQRYNAQQAVG